MRYLLLFILCLIILSFKVSDETETSKLYQQALCAHLSTGDKIDTVYIMKCFDIKLPSKIKNYHIIDVTDSLDFFLKNKKSLYVIKLLPIEINQGNIEIGIIDYGITKEKGEVMMIWSGSEIFIYKYSTKVKQYKLINIKKYMK